MADKSSQSATILKAGLGILSGSVLTSEVAQQQERAQRPVKEHEHYLAHEIFECQDGSGLAAPALVFLHGWPDDVAMFRPFAMELSKNYRCINCNLPGYPLPPTFKGDDGHLPKRNWGFTLGESALCLKSTIQRTCSRAKSVTLVTHDWGAVSGYILHNDHPGDSLIQRMISLDVGWRMDGFTLLGGAAIVGYQAFLNLFLMMPASIGNPLTDLEQRLLNRTPAPEAGQVTIDMNWPYRSAWRDLATFGPISKLKSYVPRDIPMLFIHGDAYPDFLKFHDKKWEKFVKQSCPGVSRVVPMKGNHWFLNANYEKTLAEMKDFLEKSEAKTPLRQDKAKL